MTVVLELPEEIEASFQTAAQERGVSVQEFLIHAGQLALAAKSEREAQRLAAIEKLRGFGRGSGFGSEAIRRDRNEDLARDERDFQEHFGQPS